MDLTPKEAVFMRLCGNTLLTFVEADLLPQPKALYPRGWQMDEIFPNNPRLATPIITPGDEYEPLPAGKGRYTLWGTCGYLIEDEDGWAKCGVYDERPEVCQNFPEGGEKCRLMRVVAGVDPPTAEYPDLRVVLGYDG